MAQRPTTVTARSAAAARLAETAPDFDEQTLVAAYSLLGLCGLDRSVIDTKAAA